MPLGISVIDCEKNRILSRKMTSLPPWNRHETAISRSQSVIYGNNSRSTEQIRLNFWPGSVQWCRFRLMSLKVKNFGFWFEKSRHYQHETAINRPQSVLNPRYMAIIIYLNLLVYNSRPTERIRLNFWPGSDMWCRFGFVSSKNKNFRFWIVTRYLYLHETVINRRQSAMYGYNSRSTEQIHLKFWPGSGMWYRWIRVIDSQKLRVLSCKMASLPAWNHHKSASIHHVWL